MIIISLTILFILLFVLLAVLTFARDLLASILSSIVGFFRRGKGSRDGNDEGRQTVRRRSRSKKKVYSDSDGEYVDFEEVKKK
jgi:hypothetical protein